jgi:hypothetical protein
MQKRHLFLDFDGVICDSIDETFVSSWIAFTGFHDLQPGSIPLSVYHTFRKYRPFIRGGRDYMLIQRCIAKNVAISNQEEFDAQADQLSEAELEGFHRDFYGARGALLENERAYWLGLNRIYPEISRALETVVPHAWILTTKEAAFAHEIITSKGFDWSIDRIICSGKDPKLGIIEEAIDESDTAVFIDDQVDHFTDPVDPRISCYLASWGYILPEWLEGKTEVLTPAGFVELVERLF